MHKKAYDIMNTMYDKHAKDGTGFCYDIGSYDVNGTFKPIIDPNNYKYVGLDIEPGPNVDVIIPKIGNWSLPPAELVISGNCMEHVARPWEWILDVRKLMKNKLLIQVPYKRDEHRYPIDCWRILPDGMKELFKYADIEYIEGGLYHADCWAVGSVK